jgi:hypothetical protein
MMEQTEEDEEEYAKTAKKFRSVFSLNEKEELIDRKSWLHSSWVDAHCRLPWILVSSFACLWTILHLAQLLLFPIIPTALQDQGQYSRTIRGMSLISR